MKLAVPTLVNYEGLARLVESAQAGTLAPSGYMIIDNGGRLLSSEPYRSTLEFVSVHTGTSLSVVTPGKNLGVAASWNCFLDNREPIIIANDDIVLRKRQFEEMVRDLASHPFVGNGWCLFGQTPECTARVGFYDENFFPACYEDSDYSVRMERAGIKRYWGCSEPVDHAGCWTTTNMLGNPAWLSEGLERCRQYFVRKWGVMPNDTFDGYYSEPFNGAPPADWTLRCWSEEYLAARKADA